VLQSLLKDMTVRKADGQYETVRNLGPLAWPSRPVASWWWWTGRNMSVKLVDQHTILYQLVVVVGRAQHVSKAGRRGPAHDPVPVCQLIGTRIGLLMATCVALGSKRIVVP